MQIPKTIKILGMNYEIKEVDYIERERNLVGRFDEEMQEIRIRKDISEQFKEQTLIHELVHGILVSMGKLELHEDEVFVTNFSNILHQIIMDNRSLFL